MMASGDVCGSWLNCLELMQWLASSLFMSGLSSLDGLTTLRGRRGHDFCEWENGAVYGT